MSGDDVWPMSMSRSEASLLWQGLWLLPAFAAGPEVKLVPGGPTRSVVVVTSLQ